MQTLTELALRVIEWERIELQKGAYRIAGAKLMQKTPRHVAYRECTNDARFADELMCVKAVLGLSGGVWVGMVLDSGTTAIVLALLLEQ